VPIGFITTGLIYIVIGFGLALIFYYVLRKNFIGKVWGAVIVGITGSFIGGFVDVFIEDLRFLAIMFYSVNIVTPCIAACLFLWIFHLISSAPETY
jgi:uncharacterized membrane protein YeaQ/YmgE (transglycosylase-associated protein family)